MSRTFRKLPNRWCRNPKHKHKLLDGEISKKKIVSGWDEKPIKARKEVFRGDSFDSNKNKL